MEHSCLMYDNSTDLIKPRSMLPFSGDIPLTYLRHIYEWELVSRGKRIQFCILTGNEKMNLSHIYQIRALTVFV